MPGVKIQDTVAFRVGGNVYEGVVCAPWHVLKGYWSVQAVVVPSVSFPGAVGKREGWWAVHASEMVVTSD